MNKETLLPFIVLLFMNCALGLLVQEECRKIRDIDQVLMDSLAKDIGEANRRPCR